MSRYPILCRHCGAPIVPASRKQGEPDTWTHHLGNLLYRPNCLPDEIHPTAEPET